MILIDLRPGDTVTINGVTGSVCGLDGVPEKVAFIDLEPK